MDTGIQRHAFRFTASGGEYFRIWAVNLLLVVLTLGLYLPWARARTLRYFARNTWLDGDAFDFDGSPAVMLRGTLVAAALLAAYTVASRLTPGFALAAALAAVLAWPWLHRGALRFRLAHTRWRGVPLGFAGSLRGSYAAWLPLLVSGWLPFALYGFASRRLQVPPQLARGLLGLTLIGFMLTLPWLLWRLKRWQHGHFAWGAVRTRFTAPVQPLFEVLVLAGGMAVFGLVALWIAGALTFAGAATRTGVAVLVALAAILVWGVAGSYARSHVQNIAWSGTVGPRLRFHSDLRWLPLLRLQLANLVLTVLTLGLYWPFAAVAVRRLRLQAVCIGTRGPLAVVAADPAATNASGDMATGLLGLDAGL